MRQMNKQIMNEKREHQTIVVFQKFICRLWGEKEEGGREEEREDLGKK